MSSKRRQARDRSPSSRSPSPAPPPPPPPPQQQHSTAGRRASRRYSDKPPHALARSGSSNRLTIVLAVFRPGNHEWHSVPLTFNPHRATDEELWVRIREIYRTELFPPLWRLLYFKKLKHIEPITFDRNGVPRRTDSKDDPNSHQFMHCYHHPRRLRTGHEWVDWFVEFRADPDKTYGLEFIEGLWADKLAFVAIAATVAIIVVSIVWCVKGGNLQTVFTVMGFVLSGVAAEIALVALYYQVTLPG